MFNGATFSVNTPSGAVPTELQDHSAIMFEGTTTSLDTLSGSVPIEQHVLKIQN
jgi:hypothetical protein